MKRLFLIFCLIVFTIYWLRFRKPKIIIPPPGVQQISSNQLKLRLELIPRCDYGEFDAMEMDTVLKPSSRILLTLEDKSSIPYLKEVMNLEELLSGRLKYSVPPIAGNTLIDLYLCLDTDGRNKCGSKDKLSLPESRMRLLKAKKQGAKPQDPIYYHKLLIFTNDGILYLPQTTAFANENASKTFNFLNGLGPSFDTSNKWAQILLEASQKAALFPTVNLETKENTLIVKLARYQPAVCGRK